MKHSIVLTGSTGVVGSNLARELTGAGHLVVGTSRSQEKLDEQRKSLPTSSQDLFRPLQIDLMSPDVAQKLCSALSAIDVSPTAIIHNARNLESLKIQSTGVSARSELLSEYTMGVIVPYEITMALANTFNRSFKKAILISSIYGVVPFRPELYDDPKAATPIQYSVTKAAQVHLGRELAVRLSGQGVEVNTISYGGIRGRASEEFASRYRKQCLLKGLLDPKDVVGPVVYLLNESSGAMTAQNIILDGGFVS